MLRGVSALHCTPRVVMVVVVRPIWTAVSDRSLSGFIPKARGIILLFESSKSDRSGMQCYALCSETEMRPPSLQCW